MNYMVMNYSVSVIRENNPNQHVHPVIWESNDIYLFISMTVDPNDNDYRIIRFYNEQYDFECRVKIDDDFVDEIDNVSLICKFANPYLNMRNPGFSVGFIRWNMPSLMFDFFDQHRLPYPEYRACYRLTPIN